MKYSFVDSNIFLEVFARTGIKSDRCLAFLESGKKIWTTEMVLSEIEWVLRAGYELPKDSIVMCLKRVLAFEKLYIDRRSDLVEAISLYEEGKADWVDCIHAVACRAKGVKTVTSYNKHYDRFRWIERVEP